MTTYYVAKGGSNSGGGTSGSPFGTIKKAMQAAKSGDDIVVRSGTYNESVMVNKDGVTLRSEVTGGANIKPPAGKLGININADNVTIKGFEVYGSTTSGITGNGVHHVRVVNNIVHDNRANGILLMESDFITVEGNVVYGNAAISARSGISIFHPKNITGSNSNDGYRVVRDNVSYNNVNKTGQHTDGNGIIFDDFNSTQTSRLPTYKFKSLIENNLVYQNGGSGVMVFHSENVMVRGNTAWHNNTDHHPSSGVWRGELQNQAADNNSWVNNVAVADRQDHKNNTAIGNFSFKGDNNTGIEWRGNTTFNGRSGDDSVSVTQGNASPSASNNNLGHNPGLTLSDVKAMAKKFPGSTPSDTSSFSEKAAADTLVRAMEIDAPTTTKSLNVIGKSGNDELAGGAGNDKLFGKAGNDALEGGAGNDHLRGGKGSDHLLGGLGKDVLVGGAGADDFVFKSVSEPGKGGGRNVIRDFSHAQGDDIDLSGIDANAKASGNQAFSFIDDKAFSGKAGQLQYKNGIVAGDVNGDKVADFHIDIANHAALHANDFIL